MGLRYPNYAPALGLRVFWRTEEIKEDVCYAAQGSYREALAQVAADLRRPTRPPADAAAEEDMLVGSGGCLGRSSSSGVYAGEQGSGKGSGKGEEVGGEGGGGSLALLRVPWAWAPKAAPAGPTPEELARRAEVRKASGQRLRDLAIAKRAAKAEVKAAELAELQLLHAQVLLAAAPCYTLQRCLPCSVHIRLTCPGRYVPCCAANPSFPGAHLCACPSCVSGQHCWAAGRCLRYAIFLGERRCRRRRRRSRQPPLWRRRALRTSLRWRLWCARRTWRCAACEGRWLRSPNLWKSRTRRVLGPVLVVPAATTDIGAAQIHSARYWPPSGGHGTACTGLTVWLSWQLLASSQPLKVGWNVGGDQVKYPLLNAPDEELSADALKEKRRQRMNKGLEARPALYLRAYPCILCCSPTDLMVADPEEGEGASSAVGRSTASGSGG